MDAVKLSRLAEQLGGYLLGEDATVTGASIDSRRLAKDELFVALRGEHSDGHRFVVAARAAGAGAALVQRPVDDPLPQWRVDDARAALAALGVHCRDLSPARVVGLTGSNGKTTVKEMIAAILARCGPTLATGGNLNNELGVPLTLCRLSAGERFAVIEMGANAPGEIRRLAGWARPHIGLVTNAAAAHLEGFGSIDGVARAKGELFESLPAEGCAVINADDRYAPLWAELAAGCRRLTFGFSPQADVSGESTHDGRLIIRLPEGTPLRLRLTLPGAHNRSNALAAAAAAWLCGADAQAIRTGLQQVSAVPGRLAGGLEIRGAEIVDDSYNANPGSLAAALNALRERSGELWLALGDMAELGADAEAQHAAAGRHAAATGVARLFGVGPLSRAAVEAFGSGGRWFEDRFELAQSLGDALRPGVVVLVKGSRSAAMDDVVRALSEEDESHGAGN